MIFLKKEFSLKRRCVMLHSTLYSCWAHSIPYKKLGFDVKHTCKIVLNINKKGNLSRNSILWRGRYYDGVLLSHKLSKILWQQQQKYVISQQKTRLMSNVESHKVISWYWLCSRNGAANQKRVSCKFLRKSRKYKN